MKQTLNSINHSGKAIIAATVVAIVALALPTAANAQSRGGDRANRSDRVEVNVNTDGEQQTRRERRRERLAGLREKRRERLTERRETRQHNRETARERRDNRRDLRPSTWRRTNGRQRANWNAGRHQRPLYRPVSPRHRYYTQHNPRAGVNYRSRQRHMAWRRHQANKYYARPRTSSHWGYRRP